MMDERETGRIWDQAAANWVLHIRETPGDEGDIARKFMLNPVLFDLLGDLQGKAVVDLGCGEGYLTRMLARRGSAAVGIDVSGAMLVEAKRQEGAAPSGASYLQSAIETIPEKHVGTFDIAVSNLVFNILPDHELAFAAAMKLLKPGGSFILAIVHPAFDDVGPGWVASLDGDVRWSANRYFERVRGVAASGSPSFHRCLSDYISAGLRAGSVLTAFKEPVYTGEVERSLPPGRRAQARIPYVAAMRFRKYRETESV